MWKHHTVPGDDDDDCVIRPCGRFSLCAGDVLLGHSELDREMIREDGAYRVGEAPRTKLQSSRKLKHQTSKSK